MPAAIFKIAKTLGGGGGGGGGGEVRLLLSSVLKVRNTVYNILSYWEHKIFPEYCSVSSENVILE